MGGALPLSSEFSRHNRPGQPDRHTAGLSCQAMLTPRGEVRATSGAVGARQLMPLAAAAAILAFFFASAGRKETKTTAPPDTVQHSVSLSEAAATAPSSAACGPSCRLRAHSILNALFTVRLRASHLSDRSRRSRHCGCGRLPMAGMPSCSRSHTLNTQLLRAATRREAAAAVPPAIVNLT